ncbi:MAG: ATP-dependent zinc metalloprotease FtsH [Actinobacteria bacterium]|nr:MAG: ATP-dependent zinc metalloprotease FtsH [Actinomycetota bacterium]
MSVDPQQGTRAPQKPSQHPGWRVDPPGHATPQKPHWRRLGWRLVLLAVILFGFNYWAASRATKPQTRLRVPYSPFFLQQVKAGNVAQITSRGTAVQGELEQSVNYGTKHARLFKTEIPAFANTNQLSKLLQEKGVIINAQPLDTGSPWWESLLFGFGPTLLFLLLLLWLMRRASGGGGGVLGGFGRSRARRYEPTAGRVTFADVAGIDEAKAELAEIVDFLKNPDRYRRLGGRIPRGVLLSGPPGTGKTLLARAVAGEADVPFFSLSASEFIEAIVGVGASRVRDLFAQAKAAAPAIIFIDELDAIGRSRGASVGGVGGHDEREQTLNQILTEMDGFDPSTGVIVLAATNRPDVLDPALLRPGRFDRRVAVQPPDRIGRRLILEVHTRSVPLAKDVDLDRIAGTTPGMVGADLANLVNEAALLAARRDHTEVSAADFGDALEKILLGAERKILLNASDRERTAYHEAGHAVVGMVTPGADPVRKVSIIPRGVALGVTFSAPEADRFSYDENYLKARIKVALGGRAADELVYGERTTGAEADIRQLTEIARQMVGRWGMSDAVGPIAVVPQDGQFIPGAHEAAERTQELIDTEVRRIVDEAHEETTEVLRQNRDKLDSLAHALLDKETLDQDEAYAAAGMRPPARGGGDVAVAASARAESH